MTRARAMDPTGADVQGFLATISDEQRRTDALTLCALMADVTGESAVMWGTSIIGFGRYRYRYASGHRGDSALASFSPRKAHLAVYLVGDFETKHASTLARLGPHGAGKGCLYLKRLSDVDMDALRELIERTMRVRRGVDRDHQAGDTRN